MKQSKMITGLKPNWTDNGRSNEGKGGYFKIRPTSKEAKRNMDRIDQEKRGMTIATDTNFVQVGKPTYTKEALKKYPFLKNEKWKKPKMDIGVTTITEIEKMNQVPKSLREMRVPNESTNSSKSTARLWLDEVGRLSSSLMFLGSSLICSLLLVLSNRGLEIGRAHV